MERKLGEILQQKKATYRELTFVTQILRVPFQRFISPPAFQPLPNERLPLSQISPAACCCLDS